LKAEATTLLQETLGLLIVKSPVAGQVHDLHFARKQERGARFVWVFYLHLAPAGGIFSSSLLTYTVNN
jgi:hypothetical protein